MSLPMPGNDFAIAIVGMAGRFPMAENCDEFWENLKAGKDCITRDIQEKNDNPMFIRAYGRWEDSDTFDHEFFGITYEEASKMDPQQGKLIETCYAALENAGCVVTNNNRIGLFAGADEFIHVWKDLYTTSEDEVDYYIKRMNFAGSFTLRASYILNLRGPSIYSKTACATSLVNIHLACQSLLNYECDTALAGGISIYPEQRGYYCVENTLSPDGYTRSFDKKAAGFVPGNGAGIVVLKRFSDAVKDRDTIYSVIYGSSVNNDGGKKIGYSAPSVDGEQRAMQDALMAAGVSPDYIQYIETHGTATKLGDEVEIQSIKNVYGSASGKIAVGSVKSNVGHLNIAAGIAGIIKTVNMLYHKTFVPSLHTDEINPDLEITQTPFYINTETREWINDGIPRMAGVSAFGVGGTNCHIILGEGEEHKEVVSGLSSYIFPISAASKEAFDALKTRAYEYFSAHPDISCADAAYTLQTGRKSYKYRGAVIASSIEEAAAKLSSKIIPVEAEGEEKQTVVFMFPGSNIYTKDDIRKILEQHFRFKEIILDYFMRAKNSTGVDILFQLESLDNSEWLNIQMLIVFCINCATAQFLTELGVKPDYVMGYSLGEYAAACFAGTITFEDAAYLILKRNLLFLELEEGTMMTVACSSENVKQYLVPGVEISGYNADDRITLSGKREALNQVKSMLDKNRIASAFLNVTRAGHCYMVEKIKERIRDLFDSVTLKPPTVPVISTMTGKKLRDDEITDPEYWASQARNPVNFEAACKYFGSYTHIPFIETGFGNQLSSLARKNIISNQNQWAVSLIDFKSGREAFSLMQGLLSIWKKGLDIDWNILYLERPYKTSLPTYPFSKTSSIAEESKKKKKKHKKLASSYVICFDPFTDANIQRTRYLAGQNGMKLVCVESKSTDISPADWEDICLKYSDYQGKHITKDIKNTFCDELTEYYTQLCVSAAFDVFSQMNIMKKGMVLQYEDILSRAGLRSGEILFCNIIDILLEQGILCEKDNAYALTEKSDSIISLSDRISDTPEKMKPFKPYAELLHKCVKAYPGIFSGETNGKKVLYPDGSHEMINSITEKMPEISQLPDALDILRNITFDFIAAKKRKIRILEIGAGTGLITWELIKMIQDYDIEYWFTDIGSSFIAQAQEYARRMKYDFMRFLHLDATVPFEEQGLGNGCFDIVISCNVIQATEDMRGCIRNMEQCLSSGGIMLFAQTMRGHMIHNMIYGVLEEWWNFRHDPLRRTKMLLSEEQWQCELDSIGLDCKIFSVDNTDINDAAVIAGFKSQRINRTYEQRAAEIGAITDIERICVDLKELSPRYFTDLAETYNADELLLPLMFTEKASQPSMQNTAVFSSPIDQKLSEIIMHSASIAIEDENESLFERGIDSLAGLTVCSYIRKEFGIEFEMKDLQTLATFRNISDYIGELIGSNESTEEKAELVRNDKSGQDLSDILMKFEKNESTDGGNGNDN